MSGRIRTHIRSNVYGLLALFLVLTGGTAQALSGSNTVFTDDIVNQQVRSADVADDSGPFALQGNDVLNNSLTGADINESTLAGVDDTCPNLMTRYGGVICIDDDSRGLGTWGQAVNVCADAELRLPTPTELYLAYDRGHIPTEVVWTDAVSDQSAPPQDPNLVDDAVALWGFTDGQMRGITVEHPSISIYCAVAPSDLY